jgi:hypothetical protein
MSDLKDKENESNLPVCRKTMSELLITLILKAAFV